MPDGAEPARPPSVDRLARSLADTGLPHPLLVDVARRAIARGDLSSVETRARADASALARTLLQPVINATGVLIHTNLGRAPFAPPLHAGYSNLELDLATGERGSRHAHAASLMARACDAEAAIIVNNCAAAVLLVLAALANGRGAVVSRGELVEIGGGFRVPEVMAQSGARLIEVGTTNRTRRADFERAIAEHDDIALLMQVHQSNYRIVGFTESPEARELATLGPPLVVDIGSGLLDAACPWLADGPPSWLRDEPAARQTLDAGAALVTFSGDKLLGGPQAGIVAGRADLVQQCAKHPLARALRPGGLVLQSMQHLALAYLRRDGDAIPFWRAATATVAELRERAETLGRGKVVESMAVPGGGTLPGVEIPSIAIALEGDHTAALRAGSPAIIARVNEGATYLDLRTIDPSDDAHVRAALATL
ncbi:MAG TPA: L-seryl-tRNA(Sec) selenium transferase [Acidimicrobiales bacterium]|nr:L-seryl-tRNA(Sec) selenium transferase [Acidimicrobiales bacterium]